MAHCSIPVLVNYYFSVLTVIFLFVSIAFAWVYC